MGGAHLTPATSPDTLGSEVRGVRDGVAHGRKLAGKDGAGATREGCGVLPADVDGRES